MKKIIFSKEARIEKAIENWSVREIVRKLGLKPSHNQFPTISDQEVDVWENLPEPWAVDADVFKRAFFEFNKIGGD